MSRKVIVGVETFVPPPSRNHEIDPPLHTLKKQKPRTNTKKQEIPRNTKKQKTHKPEGDLTRLATHKGSADLKASPIPPTPIQELFRFGAYPKILQKSIENLSKVDQKLSPDREKSIKNRSWRDLERERGREGERGREPTRSKKRHKIENPGSLDRPGGPSCGQVRAMLV